MQHFEVVLEMCINGSLDKEKLGEVPQKLHKTTVLKVDRVYQIFCAVWLDALSYSRYSWSHYTFAMGDPFRIVVESYRFQNKTCCVKEIDT